MEIKYWKRLSESDRNKRIQRALNENVDFSKDASLGYPASKLDGKVFYDDAPFLKDAPTLRTFVANPNNIGCHTFGTSESAFKGTQEIEREVLNILAVDIFNAQPDSFDGYIAPGGTEANIQAIWIYRNLFIKKYQAKLEEIVIISSEDTHYSIPKAGNLLMLDRLTISVDFDTRKINTADLEKQLNAAKENGKKYFIVVVNMGTTMFGSVDQVDDYLEKLQQHNLTFKMHIDGAYGGFVYPFSNDKSELNFDNSNISSITIDAHKMLQAPYGTGVFICRKGLIENVLTKEAEYVEGMDLTLCGSRSGANVVAIWMILATHGMHGWFEKVSILLMRTNWLCKELDRLKISYFRDKHMNIITIKSKHVPSNIANKYHLIPDKHDNNNQWYKIVIMNHVEVEHLQAFIQELENEMIKLDV